jgi:hypothetical protein
MSVTIEIDKDVYEWLQSLAIPFHDSPNSVLRRVAKLDQLARESGETILQSRTPVSQDSERRGQLARGKQLIERWGIPAVQARFRRDGTWFAPLTKFPAALCDCKGYLVLESANNVRGCSQIVVHPSGQITAPNGISIIPDYVKADNPVDDPYDIKISF